MRTASALTASSILALASLAAHTPPAAAAPGPPEFRYLDEEDDAAAEKLLAPLLKKYATPRACDDLVKVLRTKRPYPSKVDDRGTLEWTCPDGKPRRFSWILPKKYSPSKPVGALVFLHGAVSQPAPGGGEGEARLLGAPAVEELGWAVLAPSTYAKVGWDDPACRALVHHALRWLKRNVNVDENRICLAGDSDGGRGTFCIAETEAGAIAAAVPTIGSPGSVTRFLNFRNLPWLAINGGKDTIFQVDRVREMVEGMQASGIDLTWKLLDDAGHDAFLIVKHRAEVQDFLTKHPREPFPKKVEWTIDPERKDHGGGFPANTFRWIRIDATGAAESQTAFEDDGKALVRADFPRIEAVRDGNRIDVRTRGVTRYTVLVAPEMIDAKQPVEVTTNGKASFAGVVAPDARVILEEARRTLDRTSIFVARIEVEVDGAGAGAPGAGGDGGR